MTAPIIVILFAFGAALGSFLNVVATRYDGDHFLFSTRLIGGRSQCEECKKTLRWFELVPIASYVIQGGRCRRCTTWLSIQYPIIELLSAMIFVFVPVAMSAGINMGVAALWIAAFEALLVMALIDIRLGIIPDEINIFLGLLGITLVIFSRGQWAGAFSALIGAAVAGAFFAVLIFATRGKGMGMGDLKLAIPLGLLFGWPEIVLLMMSAFIIGAIIGLFSIARGARTMQGTLPFGPFLALGAVTAFFWGPAIIGWYLALLGVR